MIMFNLVSTLDTGKYRPFHLTVRSYDNRWFALPAHPPIDPRRTPAPDLPAAALPSVPAPDPPTVLPAVPPLPPAPAPAAAVTLPAADPAAVLTPAAPLTAAVLQSVR